MMRWVFYIVGIVAFAVAALSISVAVSDIQIIVAGVFGLAGLVAFGFGAMMKRRRQENVNAQTTRLRRRNARGPCAGADAAEAFGQDSSRPGRCLRIAEKVDRPPQGGVQ